MPPVTGRAVNYIGRSYWAEGAFQGDVAEDYPSTTASSAPLSTRRSAPTSRKSTASDFFHQLPIAPCRRSPRQVGGDELLQTLGCPPGRHPVVPAVSSQMRSASIVESPLRERIRVSAGMASHLPHACTNNDYGRASAAASSATIPERLDT